MVIWGQEKNQEESSEGRGRPGNIRELAGSRNGRGLGGWVSKEGVSREVSDHSGGLEL